MTLEDFEKAKMILAERGGYIKSRDWCDSLIKNFKNVDYSLHFPVNPGRKGGTVSQLYVRRKLVEEMLIKYRDELEEDINRLTEKLEAL